MIGFYKKLSICFLFIFLSLTPFLKLSASDDSDYGRTAIYLDGADGSYKSNCDIFSTLTEVTDYSVPYLLKYNGGECFRFDFLSGSMPSGNYDYLKLQVIEIGTGLTTETTSNLPATQLTGGSTTTISAININNLPYTTSFFDVYPNASTSSTFSFALRRLQFHISPTISCGIHSVKVRKIVKKSGESERIFDKELKVKIDNNCVSPIPIVNGSCGDNAKAYSGSVSSYSSTGSFCSTGTLSSSTVNFPEEGETVNWTCNGSGGGIGTSCTASREIEAKDDEYIIYVNVNDGNKLYRKKSYEVSDGEPINSVDSYFPVFSKNGQYIVYTNNDDSGKLYCKKADDSNNGFSINTYKSAYPSISPDGNNIIYTNLDFGGYIFLKNFDDTNNGTALTNQFAYYPTYSPDGESIIYSNPQDSGRIYRKSSTGTGLGVPITVHGGNYPTYSPNGQYIVFTNWGDGGKIYLKSSNDTTDGIAINGVGSEKPIFSKDGQYIVYVNANDGRKLYMKKSNEVSDGFKLSNSISATPVFSISSNSVNGQCGTNAKTYTINNNSYTGSFCLKGTPNDLNPAFPGQGQTVEWACMGVNGGQNVSCGATRQYYCPESTGGVCNVPVFLNNQVINNLVAMHNSVDSNSIMYASNGNQNNTPGSTTDTNNGGDPVNLATGEFDYNNTLMSIPGVKLPYEFKLMYKNQTYYDGTVGINWDHNYNIYLVDEGNGNMLLYNGKLGVFRFLREGTGSTFAYNPGLRANLRKDDVSGLYTLNYDLGDKYSFNVFKKISQIQDRYANHIDFSYDPSERLTQVTDTLGRNINYTYENFKIKEVTDFNGNKVTLSYYDGTSTGTTNSGSLYDLKEIKINNNGEEKTIKFEYSTGSNDSDKHNITKLFDSAGQVYVKNTYEYDRVKTQEYGNGTISYNYTLSGSQVTQNTVTDKVGNITDYFYDDKSNNTETKYHAGSGTLNYTYTYNSDGYILTQTSPNGNGTKFTYDERGNITEKRQKTDMSVSDNDVNDIVTIYTYNERNQLLTQVTPTGILTTNQYDSFGNLVNSEISGITQNDGTKAGIKRSDGTTYSILTTFVHNSKGELTKSVDGNGHETRFTYSGGLLVSTSTGDGAATRTTTIAYNSYGIPTSTQDARGNTSTYDITSFNQVGTGITAEGIIKRYEYDLNNNKTQEELILGGGETQTTNYTYDVLDELIQSSQEYDNNKNLITNIKYDNNSNIIEKTTGSGAKITYEYNSFGKVTKQIVKVDENDSSKDLITTYTYDSNQNIIKKTNPRGKETTYTYDLFDRLKNETDPYGNYIIYFYDKDSQIQEIRKYEFKPIPVLSSRTQYVYNGLGKVIKETKFKDVVFGVDSSLSKTDYDKNGNIISKIDPNGNITTFSYDEFNNLLETTDSLGNKIINTYDKNNNLLTKTVKQSNNKTATTTYTYDKDNRVLSETNELNKTKTYIYNNLNQVISKIDEKGNIINYSYDYAGKVKTETKVIPSGNITTTYTYDERGNMLSVTDGNTNTTNYEYDKLNRLVKQTYPNTKFITFTYDKNNNLVGKTDPNGTTVTNTYDDLDRLTTKSINKGTGVEGVTSESYTYDNLGRLLNGTDSDTHALSFEYDALNRLTKETNNGKSVEYTYDLNSNLTKEKLGSSETTYSYDSLNRVTSIKKNNQNIADYTYAGLENTSISLGNSTNITKTYDELSRLSSLNNAIKTYNYTYDEVGNITSDSIKNYTYDEIYRLTGTNNTGGILESLNYDKVGNRLNNYNSYIGSGANYEYSVNNLNQYTTLSGSVLKYQLQEIIEEIESGSGETSSGTTSGSGSESGTGETSSGITSGTGSETGSGETSSGSISGSGSESGTGETNTGNTNSGTTNTGTTISYTGGMVNVDDSRNYTYDDNGNIINNGKYNFKYDYKNRLVRVENGSGTVISYGYDVMDRRYKKETSVKQTQYVYSNENVLEESTTSSGVTKVKEYINGLGTDNLIAYEVDSVRYYYSKNHLGSIDGITDNSGLKLISYEYDSYGNVFVDNSGSLVDINDFTGSTYDNERLFTGREYDIEIGLYYMRARYYDSKIGRFISRDPIDIRDDVNLYSYVGNNPVMFLDLMGLGKVLIMYGPNHIYDLFSTKKSSENLIKELISKGYKRENITLVSVLTSEDFISSVNSFSSSNSAGEMIYLGHNEGWLSEKMTDEEILKLSNIDNKNFNLSLLSCSTIMDNPYKATYSNQIGQKLANHMNIDVYGSTEKVSFGDDKYNIVEGSWKKVSPGGDVYTYNPDLNSIEKFIYKYIY